MRLFSDVASRVDDPFLRHAAALAVRAAGCTAPNPLVGCVVVKDDRIVGEGFHPRAGEHHAEVFALAGAGADARDATLYVTLEPCRHHGRTPPCTDAVLAAGVSRVIIGMRDPGAVAGGGSEVLRAAGVHVEFAADPSAFVALNEGWLKRQATGTPFVTVKAALSLDGSPALDYGQRSSITGVAGADITRTLRGRTDAVLVGAATVFADDPELTVRDSSGVQAEHQPLRVVLARTGLPPSDARVFTDGRAPTLLLVPDTLPAVEVRHLPEAVIVERYPAGGGIAVALRVLGSRGVNDVLVEAGPRMLTSMWEAGAIDRLVTVTAGGMGGAGSARSFVGEADADGTTLVHRFVPEETGIVEDVVATVWAPVSSAGRMEPKSEEG